MTRAPRSRAGAVPVRSVRYATSPLLAAKTPAWRSRLLVACVGLAFTGLLGRAVWVQVLANDFYQKQGEMRYARTLPLTASRGRIVDRNGQLLATSVPAPSLWAIPKDFEADRVQRRQLARLLGMTPAELDGRLDDNPNFVWLRRQVDDPVAEQALGLKLKGVHTVREYKRRYPEGEAAAHVVGFTNVEERGQEGIELAFERQLAGTDGTRRVIKDRLGRVVEDIGESVAPIDGRDVELSIDGKVQFFAYQRLRDAVAAHKAKAGSAVVLDVATGEVLALANYPSFNPGERRQLAGDGVRNRALTDTFEPGSTMKPFTAALALETGKVRPDTVIKTAPFIVGNKLISDTHAYPQLSVAEVIQKSSNVGTVRISQQLPPESMWTMYAQLGYGQRPDVPFSGAASGRLRPYKSWREIDKATMSYGYGLSTSLFQLARAYTVFARDGELIPVSLVRRPDTVSGVRVFSPETMRQVRQMLQLAAGPGGTAPKAQVMGYSVGGKTGTARKHEQGKGYVEHAYRAWFVGLAPVNQPRIVVAVMIDEPSAGKFYGGDVAAPVFSELVQQTLRMMGVPPDLEVKSQIGLRDAPAVEESY
jgi:cell division protein FtsI (penicillin-binding protein 3)